MIITTSERIEGRQIVEYLGIVSAAVVFAAPGGNKMIMRGWQNGVNGVTELLEKEASERKANAVVATRFTPIGTNLFAMGTAVKISD